MSCRSDHYHSLLDQSLALLIVIIIDGITGSPTGVIVVTPAVLPVALTDWKNEMLSFAATLITNAAGIYTTRLSINPVVNVTIDPPPNINNLLGLPVKLD